jgi:hypothetical protein
LLDVDEQGSDYIGSEAGDVKPKPLHPSHSKADDEDSDRESATSSIAELDGRIINALLDKLPQHMQTYTIKVRKNVVDQEDMPVWVTFNDLPIIQQLIISVFKR